MMKIEGSGSASGSESESGSESASESGSISQRHGSADPDPHQNVMDPQHCILAGGAGANSNEVSLSVGFFSVRYWYPYYG
jgi:hypothetical protein